MYIASEGLHRGVHRADERAGGAGRVDHGLIQLLGGGGAGVEVGSAGLDRGGQLRGVGEIEGLVAHGDGRELHSVRLRG